MNVSFSLTPELIAEATVVLVDDEDLVTKSLSNLLFLEMDLDAITFNDPREALAFVESNPYDLIVSDFLMPGLDGIELLHRSRKSQPEAPRVLLTGYADKENAIKAINEVQLFQYVQKPWDNDQLMNVIRNGLERHHLIRSLTSYVSNLSKTQKDLDQLKRGLIRAFA